MRAYLISYYTIRNDNDIDCEDFVSADNILEAIQTFQNKGIVHKRITEIKELPCGYKKY